MGLKLTFRYRGIIDMDRFFAEGKKFWLKFADADDIVDKKHKAKDDEIEGEWAITHTVDAYHQIVYSVDFKASDLKSTTINGRKVYEGKLRVYVEGDLKEHWESKTPHGKREIFEEGSVWGRWFKKLTERDRSEDLEGMMIITQHRFMDFLKNLTEKQTQWLS